MTEKLGLARALFVYLGENGFFDDPHSASHTHAALPNLHGVQGIIQGFACVGSREDSALNHLVEQSGQDRRAGVSKL